MSGVLRRQAWLLLPALVALTAGVLGIGVRATDGGRAAVDEPQYLLTALSLWEDGDLDISDELAAERWRDYHRADLPVQTEVLADGSQISPHDPLLPTLLAAPVGVGGWVGAKVAMSLLAAACAALLAWTAAARFGVPRRVASVGSALAFGSPPLAVYAQQVYPEIPAALATLVGVAALAAPRLHRRHVVWALSAVVVLPWLGSKYLPVAAALAVVLGVLLLRRAGWRWVLLAGGVLLAAGVAYLAVHQTVWGGWTVYATGDHFQQTGEFSVVGVGPDFVGRSLRLVGLLVDRHYGLVPWQPGWLLVVPAVVALLVRRAPLPPSGTLILLAPLAAGWATATWVALTAHGFWWPGRQVVVVLPLAGIAVLWLVSHPLPRLARPAAALAGVGVLSTMTLLVQGLRGDLTWVVDHTNALAPAHFLLRPMLPDYASDHYLLLHVCWTGILLAGAAATVAVLSRQPVRTAPSMERHEPCPVPD